MANRLSFQVLEDVSDRLGQMSGRRKAVLWFNPPAFFQPEGVREDAGSKGVSQWFWQRDAVRAAVRNNVAIYAVGEGLSTTLGSGSLVGLAAARTLAEETGGDAIVNTNNFSPAFEHLVRDNSTYYVLGYVPTIEYRDGAFHNLAVRVNRPDVTVRARRGYYAPDADSNETAATRVVEGLSAAAAEAVRLPLSGGALGIDLSAASFRGSGDRGSVVLGAQLRGADLALGAGERLEIAYQATTADGKVTPGAFKVFTLNLTPESRAGIERDGVRFIDRLTLPRGRHQVRFAVHQPNGRTGTVVADVEVPDYSARLAMSGFVIASQGTAGQRTLLSDPDLKSLLSSDPTTVRRFGRRDVITAFAEVYWDPRSGGGDDYRVTANLATSSGAKARAPTLSIVRNVAREPGRNGYVMRIRTTDLAAGDYVLTLEASVSRNKVMRQVPFTVTVE